MEPITLQVGGSTWRFRLGGYLRSLRQPKRLALLFLPTMFIVAVDRIVWLLVPSGGMFVTFLLMGLAGTALLVVFGALVAIVRRVPSGSLTFDASSIREVRGGRVTVHDWEWVADVIEDQNAFTLYCVDPARSFRISSPARTFVVSHSSPDAARLLQLVRDRSRR